MAIQDIWKENLKALVRAEGGGRSGLRTVASTAHISEEYLYQIVNGKLRQSGKPSELGKAAAKKIAVAFANGRPDGWFDVPITNTPDNSTHSAAEPSNLYAVPSAFARDIAETFDKLTDNEDRQDVYIQCIKLIRSRLDAARAPIDKQANGGGA